MFEHLCTNIKIKISITYVTYHIKDNNFTSKHKPKAQRASFVGLFIVYMTNYCWESQQIMQSQFFHPKKKKNQDKGQKITYVPLMCLYESK